MPRRRRRRRLSPHFAAAEFDCRDGTKWPAIAREDLEALCVGYLEPLRREFGPVVVHSGYRTIAYNRRVGGAPQSWHVYDLHQREGVAADVSCRDGTAREWAAFLGSIGIPGLGRYEGHVHADNRPFIARW